MLPIAGNGAFRQVSLRHTPCLKGDADSFAALEYSFENKTMEPVEATFSFNAFNLIATNWKTARVSKSGNSLLFSQPPTTDAAWEEGYFSATLLDGDAAINPCWHRGEDLVSGPWNSKDHWYSYASKEDRELLDKEGPKYQYGNGCLSDGVLGAWLAELAGLGDGMDSKQIRSHLNAVYKHNFKQTLTSHANPQRPHYALGQEGGLLLCSWPNHDETSLPFVYSDEVWTGIEYQVASHLIQKGCLKKGLEIVKAARARYDGTRRNPFDEIECGHFYARAMASYALLEAISGISYDATTKTMSIRSSEQDCEFFFSTDSGWGAVGFRNGEPFCDVLDGSIEISDWSINS